MDKFIKSISYNWEDFTDSNMEASLNNIILEVLDLKETHDEIYHDIIQVDIYYYVVYAKEDFTVEEAKKFIYINTLLYSEDEYNEMFSDEINKEKSYNPTVNYPPLNF